MVKRRTSIFSRVVSFITAMSMAMLVVTVAHREVISAETGEDLVQTVSSDEMVRLNSDVMTFEAGSASTSVDVNTTQCIEVQKSEIYLNGSVLKPGTNIGDKQDLKLELEWYIPAEKDDDFSGKTFVWDITDQIHGITLDELDYDVRENGKVIATYSIGSETKEDGTTKTVLYIKPLQGFDGNHFNKRGSITLKGKTAIDSANGDNEGDKPYVKFFGPKVEVTIPGAEVYTQKSAGELRKDDATGKYYQEFIVTVVNNGVDTADEEQTILVDKPGGAFFKDGNINYKLTDAYYGWYSDGTTPPPVTITDDGSGFKISVGSLQGKDSGKNMVTVKYELEVDVERILASAGSDDALKTLASNEVYLENPPTDPENPDPPKFPSTAVLDITKLEPNINKYGTYDYDNDTITWVVTVSPNKYYSDYDFKVDDKIVIDTTNKSHEFVMPLPNPKPEEGSVTVNADGTITIPKSAFTKSGDNYVYTYTTSVSASDNKDFGSKQFKNEAKLTLNNKEYTCTGTVVKKGSRFMTKKFQNLDGNILTWEVSITVPENATSLKLNDRIIGSTYASNGGTSDMFRYNSVSLSGVDKDGNPKVVQHIINDADGWNQNIKDEDKDFWAVYPSYPTDNLGIEINTNSNFPMEEGKAFLEANAGKKIRLRYGIELVGNRDIDLLSWLKNRVTCTITDGATNPTNTAEAEYKSDVAVTKTFNEYDLNAWVEPILIRNEDGSADTTSINTLNSMQRNNKTWQVFVTFPKGLELGDTITFNDHMEGEHANSYQYSGDVISNDDIKKDVMAVGLSTNKYDFIEIGNGDGNVVKLSPGMNRDCPNLILTVTINNQKTLDALNGVDGKERYLAFMYHTVMTDEAYTALNSGDENWDITNVVDVSVNGGTEYTAEQDITLKPTARIFDKIQVPKNDNESQTGATYTLEVNKDSLQLGATNATITVTDRIGLNLRVKEDTIKVTRGQEIASEVSYRFEDKNKKQLVFTGFENATHYTITYEAEITKFNVKKDGNYEKLSDDEMQKRYGNEATIKYDGSDGENTVISDKVRLEHVNRDASISSIPTWMKLLKLKFTKKWDGDEPKPASITVAITGTAKDKTTGAVNANPQNQPETIYVVLNNNGSDEWVGETKDNDILPLYDDENGQYYYEYKVEEIDCPTNYSVDYGGKEIIDASGTTLGADGVTYEDTVTITNTYNAPEPEKIDITVNKMWDHGTSPNQKDDREAITIELYRNDKDTPIKTATLDGGDDDSKWTYTFTDLDKDDGHGHDYVYTVKEPTVPEHYKSEVSPENGVSGANKIITVTNTYEDPTATEVKIKVVKKWEGDDLPDLASGNPKRSRGTVTVDIYQDNGTEAFRTVTLTAANATADDDNVWISEPITVPKDDGNNHTYTYTAAETGVGVAGNYAVGSITTSGSSTDKTFTVTNVYQPEKINISVTKKWVDDGNPNADEIDKDNRSATVRVYRGISADSCNEKVGDPLVLKGEGATKTLNDLDKYDATGNLYIYKVVETPIPTGYEFSVNPPFISGEDGEFIVTNTYKDKEESSSLSETEPPTQSQTEPPTQSQTEPPTQSQTEPPTQSQTEPPTQSQTEPPTQSQTEPPTQSQTEPPTQSQTEPPTQSQTEPPTQSQTEPPTQSQTEPPTQSQTEPPTQSQTEPPTQSQTEPVIPSESGTPTPSDPGTPSIPNNPGTPPVPVRPVPPPSPIIFTPTVTTTPVTEPVVTTPVREEVIEDEEIDYEDVSSAAEIFDDTEEAVKRDNILIIILVAIIIIGNAILFYRSKTVDADRKYRM